MVDRHYEVVLPDDTVGYVLADAVVRSPEQLPMSKPLEAPAVSQPAGALTRDTAAASFGRRLGGYALDVGINLVLGTALSVPLYAALLPESFTQEQLDNAQGAATLILVVVYYTYKWIADSLGGTVGKLIVGLQVVDDVSLQPIGFGAGFIRTFVSFFSGLALGLGFLWAARDKDGKTWHDHAASTTVIRRRP